jgi:hypothetical protein
VNGEGSNRLPRSKITDGRRVEGILNRIALANIPVSGNPTGESGECLSPQ